MFVVIVCTNCHGSSQVEEAALGRPVQCPLCGKPTVARTREAILPVAKPIQEQPLSLDDAPQLPQPQTESAPKPRPVGEPEKPRPRRSPLSIAVYWTGSLLLTVLLMGAIYWALRHGKGNATDVVPKTTLASSANGDIPNDAFKAFSPNDGNCTIAMPGDPIVEVISAEEIGSLGGKRFDVDRQIEGVQVSFGWIDFDASKFEGAALDQIAAPFQNREAKRLRGKIDRESFINYVAGKRRFEVKRTEMGLPQGKAILHVYIEPDGGRLKRHIVEDSRKENVFDREPSALALTGMWLPLEIDVKFERKVLDPNQKIRLYFALVHGKKINADASWVQKFFNSFEPE